MPSGPITISWGLLEATGVACAAEMAGNKQPHCKCHDVEILSCPDAPSDEHPERACPPIKYDQWGFDEVQKQIESIKMVKRQLDACRFNLSQRDTEENRGNVRMYERSVEFLMWELKVHTEDSAFKNAHEAV